jgi:hypothetical protein
MYPAIDTVWLARIGKFQKPSTQMVALPHDLAHGVSSDVQYFNIGVQL